MIERTPLVDAIFEHLRTARMNSICNGRRLQLIRSFNGWAEGIVAVSASSALASLAFWKNPAGDAV